MKAKRSFSLIIGFLNLYMFLAWTYAFSNYQVHLIRVKAFREFFGGISVNAINLIVAGLTVLSVFFIINLRPKWLRLLLLILHSLTLLFILWSSL